MIFRQSMETQNCKKGIFAPFVQKTFLNFVVTYNFFFFQVFLEEAMVVVVEVVSALAQACQA